MADGAWERAIVWMLAFGLAANGYRVDVTELVTVKYG